MLSLGSRNVLSVSFCAVWSLTHCTHPSQPQPATPRDYLLINTFFFFFGYKHSQKQLFPVSWGQTGRAEINCGKAGTNRATGSDRPGHTGTARWRGFCFIPMIHKFTPINMQIKNMTYDYKQIVGYLHQLKYTIQFLGTWSLNWFHR